MCCTDTGFAPGTTGGTVVATWATRYEPIAKAEANVIATIAFFVFIAILIEKTRLLHGIGIDADAERRKNYRSGRRPSGLLGNLDLGPFPKADSCVNGFRGHLPQRA